MLPLFSMNVQLGSHITLKMSKKKKKKKVILRILGQLHHPHFLALQSIQNVMENVSFFSRHTFT